MSVGLSFRNDHDAVVLDSEYARLCVIASGRYQPTEEHGLGSTTWFPRIVTTAEPPLVFVRPDTVGAIASLCFMQVLGEPGRWSGFYVRATSIHTAQPNGRYFAAAFAAQPVARFGLRLFAGNGQLLFDSGTPCAVFTRSFQNWTYTHSDRSETGSYRNYYQIPFHFPENEYLLINSFGMPLLSGDNVGRVLSSWWDFPGRRMLAITEAFSNPFDFHLPAVFARMHH